MILIASVQNNYNQVMHCLWKVDSKTIVSFLKNSSIKHLFP